MSEGTAVSPFSRLSPRLLRKHSAWYIRHIPLTQNFQAVSPSKKGCLGVCRNIKAWIRFLSYWNLLLYTAYIFLHSLHTKQRIGSSRPLSSFSHTDPSFLITTITVFKRIFKSNPISQFSIYSRSNLTTSSKSVISLLPLTCHIPVIPGFIASRAL